MDPVLFEKCIKYISRKYTVRLFEDLAFDKTALESKNRYATIMFDDGYKDNIEFALPILEKYNVKASFYVVTDCIEKNIPTWTHILEHLFRFSKKTELKLNFEELPEELQRGEFATAVERLAFAKRLKPYLKTIGHVERERVLDHIKMVFDDVSLPEIMMSWDDLRSISEKGHCIGSHTVSHPMLATIEDEALITSELKDSADAIKKELGFFPKTISYPVGSYDERVKRLSKVSGYSIGLAVKQDVFSPQKEDIFEVSRIELYNEPWWKTKLRISNKLEEIKKVIRYR
jgi:peptidoglycan/xylan/chitin deacetylase (PgdA/CDA1 family)